MTGRDLGVGFSWFIAIVNITIGISTLFTEGSLSLLTVINLSIGFLLVTLLLGRGRS